MRGDEVQGVTMSFKIDGNTPLVPRLHPFIDVILEERFLVPPKDVFPEFEWPHTVADLAKFLQRREHEVSRELSGIIKESEPPNFISYDDFLRIQPESCFLLDISERSHPPGDLLEQLLPVVVLCESKRQGFSAAMHLIKLGKSVLCCVVK